MFEVYRRRFHLLLISSITLIFAACGGSPEKSEPTAGPAAERPAALAPGAAKDVGAEVPAAILAADYVIDEAEADSRYRGKDLQVAGLISEVGLSVEGLPYIALSTGWEGAPVQCIFDDETADISSLGIMQKVIASGTMDGLQDNAKPVAEGDVGSLFLKVSAKRVTLSGCSVTLEE